MLYVYAKDSDPICRCEEEQQPTRVTLASAVETFSERLSKGTCRKSSSQLDHKLMQLL